MRCMSHKYLIATLTLFLGLPTSCGIFPTKKKAAKIAESDLDLAGTWKGGCSAIDWAGGKSYQVSTIRFSPFGDFDKETALFSDPGCGTGVGRVEEHGTYAALGKSKTVAGANDINFTVLSASITPSDADLTSGLNRSGFCELSDWQVGKASDVLDKDCAGVRRFRGIVIYDIYRIDDDRDEIAVGRGSILADQANVDARPTELDESRELTKQ